MKEGHPPLPLRAGTRGSILLTSPNQPTMQPTSPTSGMQHQATSPASELESELGESRGQGQAQQEGDIFVVQILGYARRVLMQSKCLVDLVLNLIEGAGREEEDISAPARDTALATYVSSPPLPSLPSFFFFHSTSISIYSYFFSPLRP